MKKNKTLVLTGGSKGIGKAIIEKFASKGFNIITNARNEDDLIKLKDTIAKKHKSISLQYRKTDMAKKEDAYNFAKFVLASTNKIDVLVNNAGYFVPGVLHEQEDSVVEGMMNANFYSAFYLTKTLIPQMIKNKEGHIFNIASIASLKAYPNGGGYSISKFAMYGMSQAFREELKDKDIRVTSILPGATYTASWNGVDLPIDRFVKAEDIAETVYGAYSLSKNSVIEDIVIRPQLGDI